MITTFSLPDRGASLDSRGGARRRALFTLAVLISLALVAGTAAATSTRVRSLGGAGGFFEDDHNVLRWYGSIVDYPNLAFAELGQFDLDTEDRDPDERITEQGGGFHAAFDAEQRWGVIAAYFTAEPALVDEIGGIPGGAFTALWGRSFDRTALAIFFRGTSFTESSAANSQELKGRAEYHHWLGVGLRTDLAPTAYLDIAAEVHNTQFDYADLDSNIATGFSNSWDGWGARARAFIGLSEKVVCVPLVEHIRDIRETFSATLNDAGLLDVYLNRVGVGINYLPDPDNLVVITADYRDKKAELVGRRSLFADYGRQVVDGYVLGGRIGVESRVLAWLTLRLGVEYRRTDENVTLLQLAGSGQQVWFASHDVHVRTPLNLGLGFNFGSFSADVVVNDGAPFGLGYALTGAGRSDSATFTSITLSYGF